jgi:hypothetical protein
MGDMPALTARQKVFLQDIPTVGRKAKIKVVFVDSAAAKLQQVAVSLEGVIGARVKRTDYDKLPNGHWLFDETMRAGKATGFIYVIRNTISGRLYLGKKNYSGGGKLNKGVESNWKWYITSSKELSDDIRMLGKENFQFYCIEEYIQRGALSFAETWSLCTVEAPCNKALWYNGLIGKVSWTVKEPVTERHKRRLQQVINGEV